MFNKVSESRELKDWLDKLELLNPSHIELGLDRSRAVLERMNLAFEGRVITVGGTNGKGTTVALLEQLLAKQGISTGAYTSPHLFHFRERIRIRSLPATDTQLIVAFEAVESARENIHLTYFEFSTLAAAYLFSQSQLDFWLMEIGLGGRLDAVNLFEPDVAIVTNISLDHQAWLGDSIEEIAEEKAGIFRANKPAIFGSESRPKTIDAMVADKGAIPRFSGEHFGDERGRFWWRNKKRPQLPLPSSESYTSEALSSSLAALAELDSVPSDDDIQSLKNFVVPGRFQIIKTAKYDLIADVAHNQDSVTLLAERLRKRQCSNLTAVVGFMQDKLDVDLIKPMMEFVGQWIIVRPDIPRAASLETIEALLTEVNVSKKNILYCPRVDNLNEVLKGTNTAVIYGSFYTVGQCLSNLGVEVG